MTTAQQAAKAEAFRALHRGPPLQLIASASDAITSRLFAAEDLAAVATTSGGVSWALGSPTARPRRGLRSSAERRALSARLMVRR